MLKIIRNDISATHVDAIVNCASSEPTVSPGVESAIYAKGGPALREARAKLGVIEHGHAEITRADGSLNCTWVIHAVGPYWEGGEKGEILQLCNCYREVLALAAQKKCRSLAVPLISAGNHGFPTDIALSAAVGEISRFLLAVDMDIQIVVYDLEAYLKSGRIFGDIESYLGEDFDSGEKKFTAEERKKSLDAAKKRNSEVGVPHRYAGRLDMLMRARNKSAAQVYNGGNLSRQVFAKVYNGKYTTHPDKDTMLQLSIGLRLNLAETRDFLSYAEAALSPALLRDVIIADFISRGDYDGYALDIALYNAGCPILCKTFAE